MNLSRIATIFTALLLGVSSCMKEESSSDISGYDDMIQGFVTDNEDNIIEHIKVTLDWNNGAYQEIKYSDSHGQFSSDYRQYAANEVMTLTITLEDIDGEENGGLFESLNETITLFENGDQTPVEPMVFRLNRATASENSPQI